MSSIYLLFLQGIRSFHERVNLGPVNCARWDTPKFLKFFFGCQRLFFLFWIKGLTPVNTAIRIYFSLFGFRSTCLFRLFMVFAKSTLSLPALFRFSFLAISCSAKESYPDPITLPSIWSFNESGYWVTIVWARISNWCFVPCRVILRTSSTINLTKYLRRSLSGLLFLDSTVFNSGAFWSGILIVVGHERSLLPPLENIIAGLSEDDDDAGDCDELSEYEEQASLESVCFLSSAALTTM